MKRWIPLLLTLLAGAGRTAAAEEACKAVRMKNPAPTLSEFFATAEKLAKAWKPDAVPARLTNTSLGPLQPDGRSAAWDAKFYSAQTDSHVGITTFRGTMTCWAEKGGAGRMPDLEPGFFRDGAALYALAKEHGGAYIGQGYAVSIGTAASPRDNHATWYINYSREGGKDAPLSVIVDANTGKLERVMKH
jgi:hypothetical protein